MKLQINFFMWFMALIPILFLLLAIAKLGWSAAKAALIGVLLTITIALLVYRSSYEAIFTESLKGAWNAFTILLVIWPAIFIYELTCEVQGFSVIKAGVSNITRHELLQIMILGWIFPSFLQGITGFGVAVAVSAPLLVTIGVKPLWSVIIVLLCHSWGATFGTLALAWQALISQAGISGSLEAQAALLAAAMIWIYNFIGALCLCYFYGKWKGIKEGLPLMLIISMVQGGGQLLLCRINSTIACFIPSTAALLAILLITRIKKYREQWSLQESAIMYQQKSETENNGRASFHQAFLPYYILTLITIVCLMIAPVNNLLSQWKIGFSFPESVTGYGYTTKAEVFFSPLKPLTHAGTFLALSSLISYYYYRTKGLLAKSSANNILKRTFKKAMPSSIAILCFIIMSKLMSSSGQIYLLSQGIVNVLGKAYLIFAPLLGMLGAFITSSNMSSNILLGKFQITAAEILKLSPAVTLALQTTGGVLGTAFSPGSVILGISTTGMAGKEGIIIKRILPIVLVCALLFGCIAFIIFI